MRLLKKSIANEQFKSAAITLAVIELANAASCMADGFTASHFLGSDALAAFGLASPYFSVAGILSGILMVSCQVLCTQSIGRGEKEEANEIFSTIMVIGFVISILVTLLAVLFSGPIAMVFGARGNAASLMPVTGKALIGYFLGMPFWVMYCLISPIAQVDGRSKLVNAAGLAVAASDILLDILFVVVMKGGVFSIALATTGSYAVGLFVICLYFAKKDRNFSVHLSNVNLSSAPELLRMGLPRGVGMLARLLGPLFTNSIIVSMLSTPGMAAISVQNSLRFLLGAPGWGLSGAVLLLAGIYIGEENKKSLRELLGIASVSMLAVNTLIAIVVILFAKPIAAMYVVDSLAIQSMAETALRLYALSLPFLGLNTIISFYLQAADKKIGAYAYNFGNEFIGIVVVMYILGKLFGAAGIFSAMLVEQILLLVIYIIFCLLYSKEKGLERFLLLSSDFGAAETEYLDVSIDSMKQVTEVSEKVYHLCKENGISSRKAYHVALCLEELANNVLEHGFQEGKRHLLEIRVLTRGEDILLRVRDNCKSFDVAEYGKGHVPKEGDVSSHIGIRMVMSTAKDVKYIYTFSTNCIIVTI